MVIKMKQNVQHSHLRDFVYQVFEKAGLNSEDSRIFGDNLVEADLRGKESHGLSRLGYYLERLEQGVMNKSPNITFKENTDSAILVDGDHGAGQVVSYKAIARIGKKAIKSGICMATVKNSGHLGVVGLIAEELAKKDMIGIVMTNTSPIMAAWGGKKPILGNNPMAIAVPTSKHPLVLDIAFSITARGNIIVAAKEGKDIPDYWAVDSQGKATTDPKEALKGAVLPLAQHKGFGFALMVDILAGVLSGANYGDQVASFVPPDLSKPLGMGHCIIAISIKSFMETDRFIQRLEDYMELIKTSELMADAREILLPGERSRQTREHRMVEGIDINASSYKELVSLANKYQIKLNI